ncbi:hypothetical protein HD553DRAFT_337947 [Filobasidium floriforme]|uniref:uncharacterized protein n=1 Tax=Filobasidium floriforme TaxID=5210 RepID=UPI001E8DF25E|nr:uncharacterized protein HD553DRAFT_337947 [Filobasidium floriforme]KAH8090261.1 hypothetical protein HD553DRAFT_337947 [Filobasidium floriforme]
MASPNTNFNPSSINSQQTTIGTGASSQSQSQTAGSQSQPPTTGDSSKTSIWRSVKNRLSKGSKEEGSVLKTEPFAPAERWVSLQAAGAALKTDVPKAFLQAFERIIQQEEVCDKIISDVDTSGNVLSGGDNYQVTWGPRGRSLQGSIKQGSWESGTFEISNTDHKALEERLDKALDLASRLSVNGKTILVVFAGVNPLDGGETGYRFSFRLYPIDQQIGEPSAQPPSKLVALARKPIQSMGVA